MSVPASVHNAPRSLVLKTFDSHQLEPKPQRMDSKVNIYNADYIPLAFTLSYNILKVQKILCDFMVNAAHFDLTD